MKSKRGSAQTLNLQRSQARNSTKPRNGSATISPPRGSHGKPAAIDITPLVRVGSAIKWIAAPVLLALVASGVISIAYQVNLARQHYMAGVAVCNASVPPDHWTYCLNGRYDAPKCQIATQPTTRALAPVLDHCPEGSGVFIKMPERYNRDLPKRGTEA